jgi:hypothetical protein
MAGAAQRVITPPLGTGLAGYFHERIASRVRDDLYCHVVVLESGGARIALISCDVICFNVETADRIKACICDRTGLEPAEILLAATHTHTGPVMGNIAANLRCDNQWLEALPALIADTVAEAVDNRFSAVLVPGTHDEHDVGSNRLGRKCDGSEVFGKNDVIGPAGPIDPEVAALAVHDRSGGVRAVVVNYAMHPDVIGGGSADFFSADWPGELARALAAIYGEDTVTVFLNGACGDINHHLWYDSRRPRSGPARAVQMGRTLAGAAIAATEQGEPIEEAQCGAALSVLDIPYFTRDASFLAEIDAIRAKSDRLGWEQVLLDANDRWHMDGQTAYVPVQALRLGPLMFVGLPGEVFVRWGLEIKDWSPASYTFVTELANGWFGYIPTTDQAHRGAYGARPILSRRLIADAGRRMADEIQVLMWRLWNDSVVSGR